MDEFTEPVSIELWTTREVATLMYALGIGAGTLLSEGSVQGAQALSNLQIRLASDDAGRVEQSLNEYGDGGVMVGQGDVATDRAVEHLVEEEERDPDEVVRGGL